MITRVIATTHCPTAGLDRKERRVIKITEGFSLHGAVSQTFNRAALANLRQSPNRPRGTCVYPGDAGARRPGNRLQPGRSGFNSHRRLYGGQLPARTTSSVTRCLNQTSLAVAAQLRVGSTCA